MSRTADFIVLAVASLALAGVSACTRQPDEKIIPYVRQPEEIVPGRPLFFATSMPQGGYAMPLLAAGFKDVRQNDGMNPPGHCIHEMGGARMHTGVSGCGHMLVKTDEEGIDVAVILNALRALRDLASPRARVLRGGAVQVVPGPERVLASRSGGIALKWFDHGLDANITLPAA